MSHISYKKKCFLRLPDNKVFPLSLYSDSSLTSVKYDRYGRKHVYNPKHWCVNVLDKNEGMVVDIDKFNELAEQKYNESMEYLDEFNQKYCNGNEPPNKNSYNYFGTVYPSGSKMKDMKSFYSTKNLIDVEEFLRTHTFRIRVSCYDKKTYNTIDGESFYIETIEDILKANDKFLEYAKNKEYQLCVGISGLEGVD